jgi:hypothetical protein
MRSSTNRANTRPTFALELVEAFEHDHRDPCLDPVAPCAAQLIATKIPAAKRAYARLPCSSTAHRSFMTTYATSFARYRA